jgi:hypothetical protein
MSGPGYPLQPNQNNPGHPRSLLTPRMPSRFLPVPAPRPQMSGQAIPFSPTKTIPVIRGLHSPWTSHGGFSQGDPYPSTTRILYCLGLSCARTHLRQSRKLEFSSTIHMFRNTHRSFRRRRRPPIRPRNNGPINKPETDIDMRVSAYRYLFPVLLSFCTASATHSACPKKIHWAIRLWFDLI